MFCNRCLLDVEEVEHLNHVLDHVFKMEERIMTAFTDVQAAVDAIATTAETIATGIATVQTDIGTALSGTVDLSVLQANIGDAQTALANLVALVPTPAPAPEPTPEPAPDVPTE